MAGVGVAKRTRAMTDLRSAHPWHSFQMTPSRGDWMVRSAARRAIWLVTPGLLDDFRSTGARPTRSVAPIRSRP